MREIASHDHGDADPKFVGLVIRLEAFARREFGERAHIVGCSLESWVRGGTFGCDDDGRIHGVSSDLGRTLEDGQQEVRFSRVVVLVLHLFRAVDPAVGDLVGEAEVRIAIDGFGGFARGGGGFDVRFGFGRGVLGQQERGQRQREEQGETPMHGCGYRTGGGYVDVAPPGLALFCGLPSPYGLD